MSQKEAGMEEPQIIYHWILIFLLGSGSVCDCSYHVAIVGFYHLAILCNFNKVGWWFGARVWWQVERLTVHDRMIQSSKGMWKQIKWRCQLTSAYVIFSQLLHARFCFGASGAAACSPGWRRPVPPSVYLNSLICKTFVSFRGRLWWWPRNIEKNDTLGNTYR